MEATHALSDAEALVAGLAAWVMSPSVWYAASAQPRATSRVRQAAMTVQGAEKGKARWKKRSIWMAAAKENGVYHGGLHLHCAIKGQ